MALLVRAFAGGKLGIWLLFIVAHATDNMFGTDLKAF